MISVDMKIQKYFKYNNRDNYGQLTLSPDAAGEVKIAIYTTSQSIQDNINYKDANYIGLTNSSLLDDKTAVEYEDKKLKVLYVNPVGRFKQVFLKEI